MLHRLAASVLAEQKKTPFDLEKEKKKGVLFEWTPSNQSFDRRQPIAARPLQSPAEVTLWGAGWVGGGSSWMQAGKPSLRQRISRCDSPAYLKYCRVSLRESKRWRRRKWHRRSSGALARGQAEGGQCEVGGGVAASVDADGTGFNAYLTGPPPRQCELHVCKEKNPALTRSLGPDTSGSQGRPRATASA